MAANKLEIMFSNSYCLHNTELILDSLKTNRITINGYDITPVNRRTRAELVNSLKVLLETYKNELEVLK